jgi:hypothetical protein
VVLQQQRSVLIYVLHTAVIRAFEGPYLGNTGTTALEKAIDQVIDDPSLYANAIPFVQSSGTGKSKLIKELAKKNLVLVLNLRENDRVGDYCKYPTKPVLEKLTLCSVPPTRRWCAGIFTGNERYNRPCCTLAIAIFSLSLRHL